jgi:hypothetical protein
MEPKELQKTKLFEKIEIKWFSTQEMMMKIKEFRPFYRKIVKQILKEIPQIKKFILQRKKPKSTTKNKRKHVRWAFPLQQQRKTRRIDRTLTPYYLKKTSINTENKIQE